MREQPMPVARGGAAEVIHVLCLMQAGFLLLAGAGELLMMGGNPAYLVLPLAKMVLLFVFAAKAAAGRRWALIGLVVVQSATIFGFWLQVAAGFLPWIDFTVNLVVLVTNLAMPAGIIYLCVAILARPRPMTLLLPVPQDPYASAELGLLR